MKVGDVVKWAWFLGTGWEESQFKGIIVGDRMAKTDYEKVRIFAVLADNGDMVEVREDADGLELVA